MPPLIRRKPQSTWTLGDPIPDTEPKCQVRVSVEAKVWSLGDSKGFSVGPGLALEVTVPYAHLDGAQAQLADKIRSLLGQHLNDAIGQIRQAQENL